MCLGDLGDEAKRPDRDNARRVAAVSVVDITHGLDIY